MATWFGRFRRTLTQSRGSFFDEVAAPKLSVLARCVPKRCPAPSFLRSDRRPLLQGRMLRAHRDEDRLEGSRLSP
jgi:hypothetical protein